MQFQPLRTYEYTLTPADALAYESLPRSLRGWRFYVLALWLASSGLVLALMPESWIGPEGGWLFWLVGVALLGIAGVIAVAAMTLMKHLRAYRRVPAPLAMRVEEWAEHFSIEAGGRSRSLAFGDIVGTGATATHLFIVTRGDLLILPAHLFTDRGEMRLLARRLAAHGRDPEDSED